MPEGDDNPAFTVPASAHLPPSKPSPPKASTSSSPSTSTDDEHNRRPDLDLSPVNRFEHGWRRIVRNFSPSWFAVTMGTGIVAVLLFFIPFHARWLYWLSVIFFCLNTALFALALLASILRYTLYPEIWVVMIQDPTNSLFLACAPMGFATLVEMWTCVCVPAWGPWATTFAWVAWMVDAVIAVAVTVGLCFTLISASHQSSLSAITAAQLLPIAATLVAAGVGAEVAWVLPNAEHALGTIVTCYIMWGIGMPMACTVLVMYYQRLAVHKLPPREVLVSSFLPLGPLGFGGFGIMYMGKVAQRAFVDTGTLSPAAGEILYVMGWLAALVLWGWGLVWFVFALATIYTVRPFPFNMGWWSFTFPLGVYASSTIQIGLEMPSAVFRYLGTIFAVAVICLWVVVFAGTIRGAASGRLFNAPCLAKLKQEDRDKGLVKTDKEARKV